MADWRKLKGMLRKWEGGVSNHPADSGKLTKWGVTTATYDSYRTKKGLPKRPVTLMTEQEWDDIFVSLYWNRCKADNIRNQSIANLIVDNCWGSGLGWIKKVQQVLGVVADGVVGNITLNAINTANQRDLHKRLWDRRKRFYEDLCVVKPSQKVFLRGWLNRLNDFKYEE